MPTGTLTPPPTTPPTTPPTRSATTRRTRSGTRPGGRARTGPVRTKRPRRRVHWLRWVAAVLVLALIGAVVWLLAFSSVLATRQVSVTGTRVLTQSQVRDAAAVPIGLPMARQDLDAVAERVARLTPVERVTVDRAWPDTVVIHVAERTPLLAVKQDVGYALVDRYGVAFDQATQIPAGIALADVSPGETAQLVEIGTVVRSLPEDVRQTITKISATSPVQLTVHLASGVTVNWGSAQESKLKAEVVTALLERKPKSIDVSAPGSPAIR